MIFPFFLAALGTAGGKRRRTVAESYCRSGISRKMSVAKLMESMP